MQLLKNQNKTGEIAHRKDQQEIVSKKSMILTQMRQ